MWPFRFVATVIARCAGNEDADYMQDDEPEDVDPEFADARLEAFLRARAGDGTTNHDTDSGTQGTTGPHEADGCGA